METTLAVVQSSYLVDSRTWQHHPHGTTGFESMKGAKRENRGILCKDSRGPWKPSNSGHCWIPWKEGLGRHGVKQSSEGEACFAVESPGCWYTRTMRHPPRRGIATKWSWCNRILAHAAASTVGVIRLPKPVEARWFYQKPQVLDMELPDLLFDLLGFVSALAQS